MLFGPEYEASLALPDLEYRLRNTSTQSPCVDSFFTEDGNPSLLTNSWERIAKYSLSFKAKFWWAIVHLRLMPTKEDGNLDKHRAVLVASLVIGFQDGVPCGVDNEIQDIHKQDLEKSKDDLKGGVRIAHAVLTANATLASMGVYAALNSNVALVLIKINSEYNEDQALDKCPQWVESEVLVELHSIQNENTTKTEILNPHLDSRLYVLAIKDTIPKLMGLNDLFGYYNVMKHLESIPSSVLIKVFWALYDRGKLAKLPTPVLVKSEDWDECASKLIKISGAEISKPADKSSTTYVYFLGNELNFQIIDEIFLAGERIFIKVLLKKKMKEVKVGSAQGCFFRVKTVNTLSKVHGQIFSIEVNWTSKLLYLLVTIGLKDPDTQSDLVEKWVEYEDMGIVFLYYNDCFICVLFQEILKRNIDNMLIPFGQYMDPLPIVVALLVLIQVYCLSNKMMHDMMILSKELFVIFVNEEENFYSMALNKSCGVYENRGYTTWFDMKLSVPKTRRVLMMHNFFPLLFDLGGTILKYHTVVEKVIYHLVCTLSELAVNWSTNSQVKIGIFDLGTFGLVEFVRSLVTAIRVAVGLHIFLSSITSSTSLRGGAARVSKVAVDLQHTFYPGSVLIGFKKGSEFMKTICCLHDSRKVLMFLHQVIIELNREVHSCQQKMYFPADIAITEWEIFFTGDTYSRSSLLQDIFRDNQLRCAHFGEQCLQCPFDPGSLSSAF
ncbi:hypothetical protein BC332_23573 [Capsicum chinense]|nr:hypothetical protein BC332_23573 [Capsicum chinense]